MQEKIYEIPLNDAFDIEERCPFCRIADGLETQSLEYILGPALMEPEVRIQTNKVGFCEDHLVKMKEGGNPLGFALLLDSYLAQLEQNLDDVVRQKRKNGEKWDRGCFVCDRVAAEMKRYRKVFYYMYAKQPEFAQKFERSEMCLGHTLFLVRGNTLKGKQLEAFVQTTMDKTREKIQSLHYQAEQFADMFDHLKRETADKTCSNALDQLIKWL